MCIIKRIIMLTIFTPTYNRAYILGQLYKSLCDQTCKDFEWLIVDDGSDDETMEVVKNFMQEFSFPIRYYKTPNGGKHRAINYGVQKANGQAFFIVDSDDALPKDSVETILAYFKQIEHDDDFAGISGLREYFGDKGIIGGVKDFGVIDTDMISIREKYHVKGDMAEVFKTSVLKEYPFPFFEGEKFMTEGVVWSRIAKKYKMRYFYKGIYQCEYLEDGLTKSIRRQYRNSPLGAMLAYSSFMRQKRSLKTQVINAINYWRYTWNYKKNRPKNLCPPFWAYLFFPFGVFFYLRDNKN